MHSTQYHKLGDLVFSISGSGETFEYLKEEFGCLPMPAKNSNVDIRIVLSNGLPPPPFGAVHIKTHVGWESGFQFLSDHLKYQVSRIDDHYSVIVDVDQAKSRVPYVLARKFIDLNYLTPAQNLAKNFMYNCFNLISGVVLLEKGAGCYLHASSIEKNGKAVAFIANGGIGKTTSMLHLVSRKGWRYLSDDIGLLDQRGRLVRTPLRMQVYAYNLLGNDHIKYGLMRSRSLLDRIAWWARLHVKGIYRTRRRVTADELFGSDKVAKIEGCNALLFMERMCISEARVDRCDAGYILGKLINLMPKEIGGLGELSDALELVECGLSEFRRTSFTDSLSGFYNSKAALIPAYKISVPQEMSVSNLLDFMESVLGEVISSGTH